MEIDQWNLEDQQIKFTMRLQYIWLYSSVLFSSICLCWTVANTTDTSSLKSPVERVFSRRKRWLLFPKGTALKFTAQVSKRLLAIYPRGFNFNLEAAVYYPMPTARIDLIPKRFRKPTTKAPRMPGPTPLNLISIPGSLIKYRAKIATKPPRVQRIDQNVSALQWVPQTRPYKWSWENLKRYQWSQKNRVKNYKYNQNKFDNKTPIHYNGSTSWHRHNGAPSWQRYGRDLEDFYNDQEDRDLKDFGNNRYGRDLEEFNNDYYPRDLEDFDNQQQEHYFDDLDDFDDSPHYHAHRSRRDLFRHFEDFKQVLGIDVKTCILRAMCDSKRFLLPPGYSMIQDILRVVLTFPTINGLKDDYSRIMGADYQTCDAYLQHKCPFSFLEWFINPKRSF